MAESAEHEFLKHAVNDVLSQFSSLQLYTFTETDRKLFDFSSLLKRDWKRPVVGQVLWSHGEGIEKDLRTLTHDAESDIKVYVAKDSVRHRQAFAEVISAYKTSGKFADLFKLKPIWIPSDFDADKLSDQGLIQEQLRHFVVDDILFNVVFGNITSADVHFLLNTSGLVGFQLRVLLFLSQERFINYTALASQLSMSTGPIREKLILLCGAGMLSTPRGESKYTVTSKGKVFLDIVRKLHDARLKKAMDPELEFVLTKLGCPPIPWEHVERDRAPFSDSFFVQLVRTIAANEEWMK